MSEQSSQSPATKAGPRPVDTAETSEACTLGRDIAFEGTLTANEDLVVLGRVSGRIDAQASLIVGREASVDATVSGQRIVVHGRVKGDITGAERVELGASANVQGDLSAPVVKINEGAQFEGRVRRGNKKGGGNLLDRMLRG